MSGFTNWAETIADSKSASAYRQKVNDSESASMWQSLSFNAQYKAAYCMAACPAGEDVIAPFLSDRKAFIQEVVKPLQDKPETIYVVPGSDAESYVVRRFPHKTVKRVSSGIRPKSIQGFLFGLPLLFQRNQSEGLSAIYHFTFTGAESRCATVTIHNKTVQVQDGHIGKANLFVTADSKTWLDFLAKEQNLILALVRRKIRITGSPKLLQAFGKCFPARAAVRFIELLKRKEKRTDLGEFNGKNTTELVLPRWIPDSKWRNAVGFTAFCAETLVLKQRLRKHISPHRWNVINWIRDNDFSNDSSTLKFAVFLNYNCAKFLLCLST
jgi:putative sterol carrier protein